MSVLNNRVMNMIVRGVLESTNDERGVQVVSLSLMEGERKDNVERFQQYGFSAHPTGECEAIVVCPAGDRSAAVVVALDDRGARITGLQPGEVAIYSDEGDSIVLGRNNQIQITTDHLLADCEEEAVLTVKRLIIAAEETVLIQAPNGVRMETPELAVTGAVIEGAP